MKRIKKPMDQRKRFFADCPNCTASYEAERYEDTPKTLQLRRVACLERSGEAKDAGGETWV